MKKKLLLVLIIAAIFGILLFYLKDKNYISFDKEEKKSVIKTKKKEYKGLFKDYYKEAEEVVSKMTLKEKVGQLFLVRYNKNDVEYLNNFYPGGYILFAKDFNNHTKESIKEEIGNAQNISTFGFRMA